MGERALLVARRSPWIAPATLALGFGLLTWLLARREDLPLRDPDGIGGPPLVRLSVILGIFVALDILPRAAARAWGGRSVATAVRAIPDVARERWSRRRTALVLVGLFSFYITYVSYRNLKGFLPFLTTERHDAGLLAFDKALFFGTDPAVILHTILGTGIASSILSVVYVIYLAFIPISLAAALVWFGDMRRGLWYATALCLNWVLGTVSYYLLPSMGPAFVAPELFADLPPSSATSLQHALWVDRLQVLFHNSGSGAADSIAGIAAFASLHTSVVLTAALIAHLVKANRWLVRGLWLYLVLVILSTIYFGWHYLLDDVAGAVIGLLSVVLGALATGHRLSFRRHAPPGGRLSKKVPAPERAAAGPVAGVVNAPNLLSGVRILMAPAIVVLVLVYPEGSFVAAAVFAVASFTDALDGHLARSRNLITAVGKLLDPLADKLLVIATLATLVAVDRLALWVVLVIAARELLVTVLRAHAARHGTVLAAGTSGKAKMGLQVLMTLVLLAPVDPTAGWVLALVGATVLLTLASGIAFLLAWLRSTDEGGQLLAPRVEIRL